MITPVILSLLFLAFLASWRFVQKGVFNLDLVLSHILHAQGWGYTNEVRVGGLKNKGGNQPGFGK